MTDFTEQEKTKLVEAFIQLDVKPDFTDSAKLNEWLQNYGKKTDNESVTVVAQGLKISTFSGDESKDTSFDVWKYEVNCLIEEGKYSDEDIKQAIRKIT